MRLWTFGPWNHRPFVLRLLPLPWPSTCAQLKLMHFVLFLEPTTYASILYVCMYATLSIQLDLDDVDEDGAVLQLDLSDLDLDMTSLSGLFSGAAADGDAIEGAANGETAAVLMIINEDGETEVSNK